MGEIVEIKTTVINESNSAPVDNLNVEVYLIDPHDNVIGPYGPLSYIIDSLQAGATAQRTFDVVVRPDFEPSDGYKALLVLPGANRDDPTDMAQFEIEGSCENLDVLSGTLHIDHARITPTNSTMYMAISATNTGNEDLADVTLSVKVLDMSDPNEPNTIYSRDLAVGELTIHEPTAFADHPYTPAGLDPGTYPVKLSGQFRCGDSNELVERDLATAAFTVLGSSVGEYIIIDLGAIGDGSSYGHGLNSFGHVTGYATVDGNSHAFLWKCGTMIDLGTGGFDNSVGWGINDSEQIAGCLYDTAPEQDANGFVWEDGAFSDIGSGPNGVHPVEARGINVKGQVTGYYTLAEGNRRAFVCFGPTDGNSQWDDLSDSGISAIAGFAESNSVALAIDNDGNLAGYWDGGGGIGGFVRLTGVVEDAGRCDGNDMYLQAINSSGQAVGYSSDGGTDTAIFYQGGSWVALDPCSAESRANGINSAGEIVGKYYDGNDWQAFIWRGGFRHDLKQQLALTSSAQNWWKLTDANAINEQGQIVGYGTIDGEVHAYRMDPLPFAVNDPNLILWLRSDTGVEKDANNFVSQWVDQSFNGNDLEATESNRPVWISDTPCCDPVISFDGIDDALSTSLGTEYDGNSTIFLVVHTGADPNGALFASDDDTSDANAFEIRVTDGDSNLHLAA
ncbi:MAG: hypothetical protein ACYTEX_27885, partial [Planctomycetota bacterium]